MKVSFLAFFLAWAEARGWVVPDLHIRVCLWLEECREPERVLMIFRGAGKSTLLAIYNAWKFYRDHNYRILAQGADDGTAYKLSRDTRQVLRRHPLTRGVLADDTAVEQWWVKGAEDARNPNMYAKGILSNVTSSRSDECQNDDVEVPKNIKNPEARENLRYRLGEQTHILVPGGIKTFVGTPHTHDSLYKELEEGGAAMLKIPLFAGHVRYDEPGTQLRFKAPKVGADGFYVFDGIGKYAKLLTQGRDYTVKAGHVVLDKPSRSALLDIYARCAWPERFTRSEAAKRRKQTRTINEWDSQYQLQAKPLHAIRLDPDRIRPYDVKPTIVHANGGVRMMLGRVQIVSATTYWDCALGKVDGDASVFAVILTDEFGHLYLHVNEGLHGDLEVLDGQKRLVGGQCFRIAEIVKQLQLPGVNVETNGVGGFVPAILRKHLPPGCGVREVQRTSGISKNRLILDALEAPLSAGFLWAHVDVLDGPMWDQMKDWKADATSQPDDYLDAPAGAITQTPVRIGKRIGPPPQGIDSSWRAAHGTYEAEFER
jgi:hypothetical protein